MVVELCQETTRNGLPAIFMLWRPTKEIVKTKLLKEKKIPLLTISQCVEQLEYLIGLNTSVVTAAYSKSVMMKSQEVRNLGEFKFEKYLFQDKV